MMRDDSNWTWGNFLPFTAYIIIIIISLPDRSLMGAVGGHVFKEHHSFSKSSNRTGMTGWYQLYLLTTRSPSVSRDLRKIFDYHISRLRYAWKSKALDGVQRRANYIEHSGNLWIRKCHFLKAKGILRRIFLKVKKGTRHFAAHFLNSKASRGAFSY